METSTPTDLPTEPPTTSPPTESSIPSTKPPPDPPTTPPTTPAMHTTTRPISPVEPLDCQNGSEDNGTHCICLVGFSGNLCEYVDNVEPDTLDRLVVVKVVINQEYKPEYENEKSPEYKEFVGNFTNQMERYYIEKKIANFNRVVVTSVRPEAPAVRFSNNTLKKRRLRSEVIYSIAPRVNGVSVTHDVVLTIPNNASSNIIYEEDVKAVEAAVVGLVSCFPDCPYNITTTPEVNRTVTDLGGICERFVNDADIAGFYEPSNVTGVITCVTVCSSLHTKVKKCYNEGICRVYSNVGALCHCPNQYSTWYLGDDCSLPISRTGFYIGISLTLCVLLLSVGGLSLFLLLNKRKQKMKKDIKKQQVNQWMTEDIEWSRSNRSDDTDNAGGLRNPSFTHDESDQEDPGFRRTAPSFALTPLSLVPDSRGFWASNYPSTQAAPGYNAPFSNAGFSQASSVDFPLRPPMRISRPQIRPSWEV
ncbi:hypothetical protein NQZ68_038134 [Dissostichus eleginoides]|nr:hypothetical protein NQZ68_038134 [Dissostichus eleginoides]